MKSKTGSSTKNSTGHTGFFADKRMKHFFGAEYCLHPESLLGQCKGKIVRAHTVQRSGGLSAIAENGHVYGFKTSVSHLLQNRGVLLPQRIGVKQASTFTGFCEYHDSRTFRTIDTQPFRATAEYCFLLAYRAFSREFFTKKAAFLHSDFLNNLALEQGFPPDSRTLAESMRLAQETGLRDSERMKKIFDKSLLSKDYSVLAFCVFHLNRNPNILCSGAFSPEYDLYGKRLQVLEDLDHEMESLHLSIIPTHTGGAAVFSWLQKPGYVGFHFTRSVCSLPRDEIPNAIGRIACKYLENVFFAPSWWEGLTEENKKTIYVRAAEQLFSDERYWQLTGDHNFSYLEGRVVTMDTNASDLHLEP